MTRIFEPLSSHFITRALGLPTREDRTPFRNITSDSRKVQPGSLFVAVPGDIHDGHDFISKALEAGATGILCRSEFPIPERPGVEYFRVPESEGGSIGGYRKLARSWRQQFSIPVLCIAGSAGKTTTKELLSAILKGKFQRVLKTQGSQNGFVGIPMTLLELDSTHEVAVVEVGIDEVGAMLQHLELVQPTASIVTAVGPEHLEKLIDLPTVAHEERLALSEIAQQGRQVFVNLDDPWLAPFYESLRQYHPIGFGLSADMPDLPNKKSGRELIGVYSEKEQLLHCSGLGWSDEEFAVPLPGNHNALNLLGALSIARNLNLSAEECRRGLGGFTGAQGRSEVHFLPGGLTVLCDYYNAQPASMEAAFSTLEQLARHKERFVCLGDMLELGPAQESYHRALATSILNQGIEHVYLYGPIMRVLHAELQTRGYPGDLRHFQTQAEMGSILVTEAKPDSAILIKGSRGMKMEEVWKLISKTRKTRMMQPTAEEIRLAANALRADELVAMPTETVYGLAGNAFSTEALTRIFSSKERPTFDPLIIHVPEAWNSLEELESNGLIDLETMNPLARERASKLIAAFWPGPLTLVLPKTSKVPDLATSGLQTVAIRMPAHPVAQKLLSEAGIPLAAPSANRFGRISPTSAQDVAAELGGRISWILDGGRCEIGLESTVLAVSNEGELQLLRPGRITAADIQKVTQAVTIPAEQITLAGPTGTAAASPGLLKSHYAPKKPLYILNSSVSSPGFKLDRKDFGLAPDTRIGILVMSGDSAQIKARLQPLLGEALEVRSLSRDGSFEKIARNLFAELRALDDSAAQVLFAEPCASEEGLGFAIADRLKRASSR